MKLIAFMPTAGYLTGAPKRLLALAVALRKERINVCVAAPADSELMSVAKAGGYSTAQLGIGAVLTLRNRALFSKGWLFKLRLALALVRQHWLVLRCIQRNGGDVVWIRSSKGVAFASLGALLSGRPLIWDVDYELPSEGVVRWLHRLGLWSARSVVFQYIEAPDKIFGRTLAAEYRNKFRTVLPGINFAALDAILKSGAIDAQNAADRPFTIIQVGTICDRKNQRLVLDTLGLLKTRGFNLPVQLFFVGGLFDEAYVSSLHAAAMEASLGDVVKFLGWREDVHKLIASSDLMLMPSLDEGVPNAVQEAMYLGVPAIVSPVGGMPEIIKHDETGWVLPLGSPAAWAAQIRKCAEEPELCRRIGSNASAYAEANFSARAWGAQYAELVREVVQ